MDGNNNQFNQQPQNQPQNEYTQYGYQQQSYQQPNYQQPGYGQQGYQQPNYQQPVYPQYGYQQNGYAQNGYPQPGFPQNGYVRPGYPRYGYGMPQAPYFDQKSAKRAFSNIGLSYFLFWVAALVATIAVAFFMQLFCPDATDIYLVRILSSILPMYLIGAPLCWILMKRVPAEAPARNKWTAGQIIGGYIVGYSLMYVGSIAGSYIGAIIESYFPDAQASTNSVQELVLTGEMWVNIIIMVMVGPVVEELLFRKLLCDRLKPYGDWVTILVTGMMFGVFHGNLTQGIYAFMFGAFLAYVYLRTGNIFITIGYHITANFMGSVLPLLVLNSADVDGFEEMLETGDVNVLGEFISENAEAFLLYGGYIFLVLGLMITGIIILIVTLARGHAKFEPGRIQIPSGKKFSTVIVNVGMILFLLSGLFEILMSTFG